MILGLLGAVQVLLALRVLLRFIRTAGGGQIKIVDRSRPERVSVILPVLNEAARIQDCLECLMAQPESVVEILVVDGGSSDGTQSLVERCGLRDPRVRLIDASPVPDDWTGKIWGLYMGLKSSHPQSPWILSVDADVRCSPQLVPSLLAHAERTGVSTFSVATRQHLCGLADALLHPSLLTTLVYRFGMPGKATRDLHQVQANGQCFFSWRETLLRTDALRMAQLSLCEDITLVRRLTECGERIGFYESAGLVWAGMYKDWHEAWRNWPRSLPMRDRYFGCREAIGLLEVLLVQALPLPLLAIAHAISAPKWLVAVNLGLILTRLGVLMGVARAYERKPWTYWLSPLLDLPVALRLLTSALRRRQRWRGRVYVRRVGGVFEPLDKAET
ncbi:MAG TPA: glycosyltransferase family 2 protein [Candidatus Binatia bacterium]|nr:glycosyltransferase family 2 protein [Candidatus Binatia bacterium]